ncbi:tetratricopeptide repeat protein [Nocardia sp. NPDC004722]
MVEGHQRPVGEFISARAWFAARLAELFEAAGNPTLQRVVTTAERRLRAARAPGASGGLSVQRLSDWRTGHHRPASFEQFTPALLTLIELVPPKPGSTRTELMDPLVWKQWWAAADAENDSATGPVKAKRRARQRNSASDERGARPRVTTVLPRAIGTFVGRERELQSIVDAATAGPSVAIHTVDGMAGIGKTALIVRAAHLLADQFPDGQYFVELNTHTAGLTPSDPFDVLGTLLTDLGIDPRHIPGTLHGRRNIWRGRLAGKRVLLVLDDARDSNQIEPLLPASPGCLVLVSSRRRLIALDDATPLPVGTLDRDTAIDLFCTLALRTPTGMSAAAAAAVVQACGYLPLAIVLAAGRLAHHPTWSITDMAAELSEDRTRLGVLEAGQRAVRAAFAASYTGLPPRRQLVFRRLGLHSGPDIDAYAAAALVDLPIGIVRGELDALYTDHLVEEAAPGRYRLHDLLREYANTLAAEDLVAEQASATDRLFDYYWRTLRAAGHPASTPATASAPTSRTQSSTPRQFTYAAAVEWMRRERPNLMACLRSAAADNQLSRVVELTRALGGELRLQGPTAPSVGIYQRQVVAAHTIGDRHAVAFAFKEAGFAWYLTDDYAAAADLLHQMLEAQADSLDSTTLAAALRTLGQARYQVGDFKAAADVLQRALAIYRKLGSRLEEAAVLHTLGYVVHLLGDYTTAYDLLAQALDIRRDGGARGAEAATLSILGWVQYLAGDHGAGLVSTEKSLAIVREVGLKQLEANVLAQQAWLRYLTDDPRAMIGNVQRAQRIYADLGDRFGEAVTLLHAGWGQRLIGDYPTADRTLRRALAIYRECKNRPGEASVLNELGRVLYLSGDYDSATDLIRQALKIYHQHGNRAGLADAFANLGWVVHLTDGPSAGIDEMCVALVTYRDIRHRLGEAETLNRLAAQLAASDNIDRAQTRYEEALEVARRIDSPLEQARALEGIARCRIGTGDTATAKVVLQEAITIYERIAAAETQPARALLNELEQQSDT